MAVVTRTKPSIILKNPFSFLTKKAKELSQKHKYDLLNKELQKHEKDYLSFVILRI